MELILTKLKNSKLCRVLIHGLRNSVVFNSMEQKIVFIVHNMVKHKKLDTIKCKTQIIDF